MMIGPKANVAYVDIMISYPFDFPFTLSSKNLSVLIFPNLVSMSSSCWSVVHYKFDISNVVYPICEKDNDNKLV
jgi:hypothetical protein